MNTVDLRAIYDGLAKADQNDKFDIFNFFVLLILFGKLTINERFELFYQTLSSFNQLLTRQKGRFFPCNRNY